MTRRRTDPALRAAVEAALIAGDDSVTAIAQRFGVQQQTASLWRQALVRQGLCTPLHGPFRERRDVAATVGGTQVAWLSCAACGKPFPYRFGGDAATQLKPENLSYVARLCLPCFDTYCATLAVTEPYVPPGSAPSDDRETDEEDDDAD